MPVVNELIERANVALDGVTPEPWVHKFRADGSGFISMGGQSVGQKHKQFDTLLHRDDGNDPQDASFIASSRQLVPELIAALSEAIALAERAEAELSKFRSMSMVDFASWHTTQFIKKIRIAQ